MLRQPSSRLGVFMVMLGSIYILVRVLGFPPWLYYLLPPLFFIYIGTELIMAAKRRTRKIQRGKK